MRYKKLSGTFGVAASPLELKDGLNVVLAPNEWGKTTRCAMILSVLYGVSTSDRAREGYIPDKIKYQPWSGKPMTGTLEMEYKGREILISRETRRADRPMQVFKAIYTDTGEDVGFASAMTVGEEMTGVSADAFSRSVFCSGESMAVQNSEELESKINAIAGTGDEEISATAIMRTLSEWGAELESRRGSAIIPKLQNEIRDIENDIVKIETINAQIMEVSSRIQVQKELVLKNEEQQRRAKLAKQVQELKKIEDAEKELESARERYEMYVREENLHGARADAKKVAHALDKYRFAQGRRADYEIAKAESFQARLLAQENLLLGNLAIFEGCEPEYAVETARREYDECQRLSKSKPSTIYPVIAVICALLGVGILLIPDIHRAIKTVFSLLLFFGAAIFTFGTVRNILGTLRGRKAGQKMLEKYDARAPEQILTRAKEYEGVYSETKARREAENHKERAESEAKDRLMFSEKAAADAAASLGMELEESPEEVFSELLQKIEQLSKLRAEVETAETRLKALESMVDIETLRTAAKEAQTWGNESVPLEKEIKAQYESSKNELSKTEAEKERLVGRLEGYSDIGSLKAELEEKQDLAAALKKEKAAIDAAGEVLKESAKELAGRLTPSITKRATELFAELTGQKYERLLLDKDFSAHVFEKGEEQMRQLLYLSRGAHDQIYLSVRIALSEVLFEDELPPLVLDDVLLGFDDERAENAMNVLAKMAQVRQIIIFTCRERDVRISEKHRANIIKVKGDI